MTILVAILVFGVIVLVHEFGHFILAKKNGVKVHEFAIGMGPKIFSIKKDTEYTIRILPLGGFIRMEGEDEDSDDPRSFNKKSILQRASIIFAGPLFNLVFAVIVLIPVFMYIGTPTTSIKSLIPDSPAISAGFEEGDKIIDINGQKIESWKDIVNNIDASNGDKLTVTIEREGKMQKLEVTPENDNGKYKVGIAPTYEKNILASIGEAFRTTVDMIVQMIAFLVQLVTGNVPGGIGESVTGPLGIIGIVGDATKAGFINVLNLTAMISLNLGIINLVPIPALDGGRLVFLAIEALRGGKKLDAEREGMIHFVGFALLMAFTVFITYKDILRLMK